LYSSQKRAFTSGSFSNSQPLLKVYALLERENDADENAINAM
jgi:hypothetical protein